MPRPENIMPNNSFNQGCYLILHIMKSSKVMAEPVVELPILEWEIFWYLLRGNAKGDGISRTFKLTPLPFLWSWNEFTLNNLFSPRMSDVHFFHAKTWQLT